MRGRKKTKNNNTNYSYLPPTQKKTDLGFPNADLGFNPANDIQRQAKCPLKALKDKSEFPPLNCFYPRTGGWLMEEGSVGSRRETNEFPST